MTTNKPTATSPDEETVADEAITVTDHGYLGLDRHAEKAEDLRLRLENWIFGECHSMDDLPASSLAELEADQRSWHLP